MHSKVDLESKLYVVRESVVYGQPHGRRRHTYIHPKLSKATHQLSWMNKVFKCFLFHWNNAYRFIYFLDLRLQKLDGIILELQFKGQFINSFFWLW